VIASDFKRIAIGNRGSYVEFGTEQIVPSAVHITATHHYYYVEYKTTDGIKVYYQLHRVSYANYVPEMWYIAPMHLQGFERTIRTVGRLD
jgi:hypothetical protein